MILTEQHCIKKGHSLYNECDNICFKSKNLYNTANYIVRQEFISSYKENGKGTYLNYYDINKMLITNTDYCSLPRKVSKLTLMLLDKNWKSFFALIKLYNKNKSIKKPNLPNYLNSINGRFITTYELGAISVKYLRDGKIKLSGTNIILTTKKRNIKQCRIVPKGTYYVIEILYEVITPELKEDNQRYCSIDIGVNNLATVGSNIIKPFIINGKPLKSINRYYNKKKALLQSKLKDKKTSKRIERLTTKRNNKIKDYIHKSSTILVNHLVSNNICSLVIGKNKEWKQEINIGKVNNQKFVSIPHATFINMLEYKCKMKGINVTITEESYTSKCSFLDNEPLVHSECYKGKRIKRGLFKSSDGRLINADLNGSLNILRKVYPNIFKDNGLEVITVSPLVYTTK